MDLNYARTASPARAAERRKTNRFGNFRGCVANLCLVEQADTEPTIALAGTVTETTLFQPSGQKLRAPLLVTRAVTAGQRGDGPRLVSVLRRPG